MQGEEDTIYQTVHLNFNDSGTPAITADLVIPQNSSPATAALRIINPNPANFQVGLQFADGGAITPEDAELYGWRFSYVAFMAEG